MSRRYDRFGLREDASEIAREIVSLGESTGWAGDVSDVEAIQVILAPFGIRYTDDMRGTWAPARPFKLETGGPEASAWKHAGSHVSLADAIAAGSALDARRINWRVVNEHGATLHSPVGWWPSAADLL